MRNGSHWKTGGGLCPYERLDVDAIPYPPSNGSMGADGLASRTRPPSPGIWLQGRDLNPRPRGYEPREIPLLHPDMKNLRPSFGGLRDGQKVIRGQLDALLLCRRDQCRHMFERDDPA